MRYQSDTLSSESAAALQRIQNTAASKITLIYRKRVKNHQLTLGHSLIRYGFQS